MKNQLITILIVAMTLATAWAIRGQFGHEPGAAWAGAIGGLALVLVSKRKDWYTKIFSVAFASAVGWGAGGMMSYGIVVGYGRSCSLPDAFYGLLMLFVIGGLYGILGGGLVGLSLDSTNEKRVSWGSLFAEMVAGGLIGYYLLIVQFEWLMTPPRSEAWALCFGAGMALLWHMARNNYTSPLRVSLWSALGAGFGFAFGNFLQTLGTTLEIQFNMWNVMEYSIGFFGGTGMAYGVFSSPWPVESRVPERWESRISMLGVFVIIPFIILIDALGYNTLMERIKDQVNPETTAMLSTLFSILIIFSVAIIGYFKISKSGKGIERKDVLMLFIVYLTAYILISYIVSGVFAGRFPSNHQLYVVNLVVILWLMKKEFTPFFANPISTMPVNRGFLFLAGIVIIIMLLSLISVNSHGVMGGAHERF
jgi:hypothetical protein